MPTELCAYGFSCASMMMQPTLTAPDCPNKKVCGTILKLSEEEQFELQIARMENEQRRIERIRLRKKEAAKLLLMRRGCPQTLESLGLNTSLEEYQTAFSELIEAIQGFSNDEYIAPKGVEAHRYKVKRPYKNYEYNKLSSKTAIFAPQSKNKKVKVIHLSKDTDARNLVARSGIERRNRLLTIQTLIKQSTKLLKNAVELTEIDIEAFIDDRINENITE